MWIEALNTTFHTINAEDQAQQQWVQRLRPLAMTRFQPKIESFTSPTQAHVLQLDYSYTGFNKDRMVKRIIP